MSSDQSDSRAEQTVDRTRRALLAAAAGGVVPASRPALASTGSAAVEIGGTSPDRDWPMVGFGPGHSYHQYQTDGPGERLRLAWRYDGLHGTPIVADGTLYATGLRPGDPTDAPELHAVDLESRERTWWTEIPGRRFVEPAVAGGTVYVNSEDGGVFALDAATGEVRWHRGVNDAYYIAPPTVADGTVFVPRGGDVIAFAADGRRRWCRYGNFATRYPVAVAGGLVYAGVDNVGTDEPDDCRAPGICAFDAETGELAWSYDAKAGNSSDETDCGTLTMPPVVADGTLYACVRTNDDEYWDLTALDAESGATRWTWRLEGGTLGSVAAADGRVYVPLTQRVVALDAGSGSEVWTHHVEVPDHPLATEHSVSTPTVADGSVYIGTFDGRVRVLDTATGDQRCEYVLGGQYDLRQPTTVVDGTVYVTGVAAGEGRLQAADTHLFALAESGDGSVTADFRMGRTRTEVAGRGDDFRTGREMGFYADRSAGPIATYEWDLTGDGSVDATGRLVTHTYEETGSKTATLRVTGETGATDTASESFSVTD